MRNTVHPIVFVFLLFFDQFVAVSSSIFIEIEQIHTIQVGT